MTSGDDYTYNDMCTAVGKSRLYVRNLVRALGLPIAMNGEGYSREYVRFLEKAVSLRAFSVSVQRIVDLLEIEKKILRLLHIDSLSQSMIWYLDGCCRESESRNCLLLTGYDIGFSADPKAPGHVQHHLDFSPRDPELFTGAEMGEDVRRVLEKYHELVEDVRKRVEQETPVLRDALSWAGDAFQRLRR